MKTPKEEKKTPEQLRKEEAILKAEQQLKAEDMKKRLDAFTTEFLPLLGKYKIGLAAEPLFVRNQDPRIGFTVGARPVWFDDSKNPVFNEGAKNAPKKEDEESAVKAA